MEVGNKYEVVVEKIIKTGAIVRFVDEDIPNGFIHISNIADAYIDDIHNFIEEGHTYIATCIEGKVKPEELSLKSLGLFNKSTPSSKTVYASKKSSLGSRHSGNSYKQDGYRRGGIANYTNRRNNYRQTDRNQKEYQTKSVTKSLDDMIQEANSHLIEKMASRKRK